jgi:hypothetical protein
MGAGAGMRDQTSLLSVGTQLVACVGAIPPEASILPTCQGRVAIVIRML